MPTTERDMLDRLIQPFSSSMEELGEFTIQQESELPSVYRRLLAHEEHMTVTVEAFHGCPVNVQVLDAVWNDPIYCRRIVLRRSCDRRPVLFGLVRLDTSVLPVHVRDEIIRGEIPLGRVLIQNDVLRRVKLDALWKVRLGSELMRCFDLDPANNPREIDNSWSYGRTARILFGASPALELLEVVAPERIA